MFGLPACIQLPQNGSLATATLAIKIYSQGHSNPFRHYFNLAGFKQNPASDTLSPPSLSPSFLPIASLDLAVPNSQLPFASHNRQQQQLERKTGAYCAPNS